MLHGRYLPGLQKCRWLLTASKQPAAFHPLHPGDRERQQTDLLRHHSFKRTWRPPHHPRIQEAHTHQSTVSVWFTPPSISKAQYCQVPLQAHQTSRNKTFRHLRGEKHLSSVLISNGYPFSFLQKLTKTRKPNNSAKPVNKFKATAVLPYVKGLSE